MFEAHLDLLRPPLIDAVITARAEGDQSEQDA
jgi:hypothetical protein